MYIFESLVLSFYFKHKSSHSTRLFHKKLFGFFFRIIYMGHGIQKRWTKNILLTWMIHPVGWVLFAWTFLGLKEQQASPLLCSLYHQEEKFQKPWGQLFLWHSWIMAPSSLKIGFWVVQARGLSKYLDIYSAACVAMMGLGYPNHQRRKIKLNWCKLLKFGIHNLLFDIRNVFLENRAEERYKDNLIPLLIL